MTSPLFQASKATTDSTNYKPSLRLPEHLMQFQQLGKETRAKMDGMMQAVLELTDKMALRGAAALPEGN